MTLKMPCGAWRFRLRSGLAGEQFDRFKVGYGSIEPLKSVVQVRRGTFTFVIAVTSRYYPKNKDLQHRQLVIAPAFLKRVIGHAVVHQHGVICADQSQLRLSASLGGKGFGDEGGHVAGPAASDAKSQSTTTTG